MSNALITLDRAKRACTGFGLRTLHLDLTPSCGSRKDFADLVNDYYQLFREEMSNDVVFLRGFRRCTAADAFDSAIHELRTGAFHSTSPGATEFYEKWLADHAGFQAAADNLVKLFHEALEGLASNAILVLQQPEAAKKWTDVASTDIGTIMQGVIRDLGRHYSPKKQEWLTRQVEGRLKIYSGSRSRQSIATEFCVQELVSQNEPLPVSYVDVLDHLGLLGDAQAEGAILVAYSVASVAPTLRASAFLDRVEQTWRAAAAY